VLADQRVRVAPTAGRTAANGRAIAIAEKVRMY
jgi:hypothetical protein